MELLGKAPQFEKVPDGECTVGQLADDYNGVPVEHLGNDGRIAVYQIIVPPPSNASSDDEAAGPPLPAVVGGVAAVAAVVLAGVALVLCTRRRKKQAADGATRATNVGRGPLKPASTVPTASPDDVDAVFMDVAPLPTAPQSTPRPPLVTPLSKPSPKGAAPHGCMSSPMSRMAQSPFVSDPALDAQFPERNIPLDPEYIGHQVYNLHVMLPDHLSTPPLRLLHIHAVAHRWRHLPVYEAVHCGDYIEVPYRETRDELWDSTCMLSWRWAKGKPPAAEDGVSPMSEQQFLELKRKMGAAAEAGMKYVWIDWSCVPQYVGDPLVEIHRSRLYYARARALIVLPGFRQLSTTPVMMVALHHAQLLLRRSSCSGDDAVRDRLIARALHRIIDAKAVASREYFGRVWTLAERMARHSRKEKLCEWLSLDLWLGMVMDAMLGGKDGSAAAIYWRKLFPSDVLKQLSAVEQEIRLAVEAFHTSTDLYQAVADVCRSGYQVWTDKVLHEAATREWLKTYLLEEAGDVYSAFQDQDIVWSIYCFFCYEQDVTATKALRNLCQVAGVEMADTAVHDLISAAQGAMEV